MFGKSISISNIKEFKATEEYFGLDEMVRKCQNREPYENCTSRLYLEAIQKDSQASNLNNSRSGLEKT